LVTTVVLEAVLRDDLVWRPIALAFGFGLAAAVLVRRTHPIETVAFSFGTFALLDAAALIDGTDPVVLYSGMIVLLFAYSLFRWGSGRHAVIGLGFIAAAFVASSAGVIDAIGGVAIVLFSAVVGVSIRYRDTARAQLVDQAKLQERERLARELHDTVAHHVSAITIQAQAGLFLAGQSSLEGAVDALQTIEREASQTLAEMRTMVSALRDRDVRAGMAHRGTIADLEQLTAGSTDALRIDVELRGELGDLPAATQAALYRVAQESVTNAKLHARRATQVKVEVIGSAEAVHLTITDDGARSTPAGGQPGYGLVGMTERVTVLGGTLDAGPKADRGWAVTGVRRVHRHSLDGNPSTRQYLLLPGR
jgi:signal transduction histidine kinase